MWRKVQTQAPEPGIRPQGVILFLDMGKIRVTFPGCPLFLCVPISTCPQVRVTKVVDPPHIYP